MPIGKKVIASVVDVACALGLTIHLFALFSVNLILVVKILSPLLGFSWENGNS